MKANSMIKMAILYGLIVLAVTLVFVCRTEGQIVEYRFERPGSGGMVSNYDNDVMGGGDALYLLNGNVSSTPGSLNRRLGVWNYGNNNTLLYSAHGYYSYLNQHKLILGVTDYPSDTLGQFVISDTFALTVDDTLSGNIFPYTDTYHDRTPYKDFVVLTDGHTTPCMFTTRQSFYYQADKPDSIGYEPHVISMGLEAPGQPRVGIVGKREGGALNDDYIYAFVFASDSAVGIESRIIRASGENIYITNFPMNKAVCLLRRKAGADTEWRRTLGTADTFKITTHGYYFIDSLSDDTAFTEQISDTLRRPGQFYYYGYGDSIFAYAGTDTFNLSYPCSTYYIAYSYFDPVTGMESALGPLLAHSLLLCNGNYNYCLWGCQWRDFPYFRVDDYDTSLNPITIRVYQSIVQTILPGAGDSSVLYGAFQTRKVRDSIRFGGWSDSQLVRGLDSQTILDSLPDTFYTVEFFRNDFGGTKVLPPYHYDCRIPFTDIEYMTGRFWGLGDFLNPSRLYFGDYDAPGYNIFNWNPLQFIDFLEIGADELVAVERAEGFGVDVLYVFAHNSVWIVDELGDYQIILPTSGHSVGAASRQVIVKHGAVIYFITPDLRIYSLSAGELKEISLPIENYVESVFVGAEYVSNYDGSYVLGHAFGDCVRWFNTDTTGMGLSYDTRASVWSLERYGSGIYVPNGSFMYDTLHIIGNTVVPTIKAQLLYTDSATQFKRAYPFFAYDQGDSTAILERAIQFAYQTPRLGDGKSYYQVREIDLTIRSRTTGSFNYTIYNESGDSLCGDSITVKTGSAIWIDTIIVYRIHPPYNCALYPSVRIYTDQTDTLTIGGGDPIAFRHYHNFDILNMGVKISSMGKTSVK